MQSDPADGCLSPCFKCPKRHKQVVFTSIHRSPLHTFCCAAKKRLAEVLWIPKNHRARVGLTIKLASSDGMLNGSGYFRERICSRVCGSWSFFMVSAMLGGAKIVVKSYLEFRNDKTVQRVREDFPIFRKSYP